MALESTRTVREWGGEEGVPRVAEKCLLMCVQNYFGAQFILPTRGPILGTSPAPITSGDWGVVDLTVNPELHVQNGFINFCCHELTQISENDQGILT